MDDSARFIEELVDLQTVTEQFQGEDHEQTTGRVVLHGTKPGAGQTLCGRELADAELLTRIDRAWDAGYLPHLPRCERCAASLGDTSASHMPGPATDVDIRTAHGLDAEKEAAAQLRAVLDQYDLRRWINTDVVTVDDEMRGGLSHPLTLSPRVLTTRPLMTLTTFLHEQSHWIQGPGIDAATTEASRRWPDPPGDDDGGGHHAQSTWLHIAVCGLEFLSLSDVIGTAEAEAELRQHTYYAWIYEQILADQGWLADFLARHDLRIPQEIPVPRRYVGPGWREVLASLGVTL
jgi:hypothetical protein